MKNKLRLFSILALILAFPLVAGANIDVDPTENFGDVELGSSATAVVTVQNVDFIPVTITSVTLDAPGGDFAIAANPEGLVLGGGESADVVVTFTPSAVGPASATLFIDWTNGGSGNATVALEGVGIQQAPPAPPSVQDILAFFDASVANGTLYGNGPGNSANGRKKALRNKIKAAGNELDKGKDACGVLLSAYQRADSLPRPPEFVAGTATQTLAEMILSLMGDLGCE